MKKLLLIAAIWLLNGIAFAQQDTTFVAKTQQDYDISLIRQPGLLL